MTLLAVDDFNEYSFNCLKHLNHLIAFVVLIWQLFNRVNCINRFYYSFLSAFCSDEIQFTIDRLKHSNTILEIENRSSGR